MSRRGVLTAAGAVGAAVAASPLLGGTAAAAPAVGGQKAVTPVNTPAVNGLHLQFGADASAEVIVSWHTLQPVREARVLLGNAGGQYSRTYAAETVSYTDAKSGQVVYAHHARLTGLRPGGLTTITVTYYDVVGPQGELKPFESFTLQRRRTDG
ncbi:fibronectin type III domain-containing protein [Streptomyces sp. NPDC002928]|uniref:fibronectin type III domain-containing protein n=1 Tax=Streptomyces sp. NPDC002928 TaxID=3154440 RepID=UPI0033BB28C1